MKHEKQCRMYLFCLVISVVVLVTVFLLTDGWFGDKEFSQYNAAEWQKAMFPLIVMGVSAVSVVVFLVLLCIPAFKMERIVTDYFKNKKFNDLDEGTAYIIFDRNEYKRACCLPLGQNGVWLSVKNYNLSKKDWDILEKGKLIHNVDELEDILKSDYGFDQIKVFELN